jgi:antitoxin HicB
MLKKDGQDILVTFKDVPEAITFGKNENDALKKAVDALETGLSFYVDKRKALPFPSKPKRGQKTVSPSTLDTANS